MKTDLPLKLKTGIFVIAGIGLLILAIFLIGNQKDLFSRTFILSANFKNVAGLQIGNAVRFGGINVGTVSDITILNDTVVQVSLRMQPLVHKFIKQDAIANIGSDGLMGDKIIQVSSGNAQSAMAKDNSLINGKDPINMEQVLTKINGIASNAESLTANLAGIVKKVNNGEGSLGRLLTNDKLALNLEGTVSSAEQTVKSIKKSADGFSENMDAVKHNFLLKGYFKKKERKRIEDSTKKANAALQQAKPKKKN